MAKINTTTLEATLVQLPNEKYVTICFNQPVFGHKVDRYMREDDHDRTVPKRIIALRDGIMTASFGCPVSLNIASLDIETDALPWSYFIPNVITYLREKFKVDFPVYYKDNRPTVRYDELGPIPGTTHTHPVIDYGITFNVKEPPRLQPGALDTLKELSDALNTDENIPLPFTVRYDENGNFLYAVDIRGNRANLSAFDNEEEAIASLKTLVNCTNCVDCVDCRNCGHCVRCANCKDCKYCKDCANCTNCEDCKDCEDCEDCKDCEKCIRCKKCIACTGCSNCDRCKRCSDCLDCTLMFSSKDCEKCIRCNDCEDCNRCTDCKNCTRCINCKKVSSLTDEELIAGL